MFIKKDLQKTLIEVKDDMRHFFIKLLAPDALMAVITGSDARHIKTVLRLKPGDNVSLFDGSGIEYEAKITALTTDRIEVAVIRRFPSMVESPIQIIIAQGLLKDRKMDGLVRHLTELGITKWIPFLAHRSIPKPDKKHLLNVEKGGKPLQKKPQNSASEPVFPKLVNWYLSKKHWIWRRHAILKSFFGKMN